jgi:MraZ protein
MQFCFQSKCVLDANGRIKLPPLLLMDLSASNNSGRVMLYCLPEGCLGIYPMNEWEKLRRQGSCESGDILNDAALRRQHRRIGSLSQSEVISNQGRITIPVMFRDMLGLTAGSEVMLVGAEKWVELWSVAAWEQELQIIADHEQKRVVANMDADLKSP